jgi:VanZ family protein
LPGQAAPDGHQVEKPQCMMRLFHRIALPLMLGWAGVILWLSLLPGPALPPVSIWEFDKFAHIGVYGLLAFLAAAAFPAQFSRHLGRYGLTSAIFYGIVAFGLAIEIVQGSFIQGRYFDVLDILANITGSILGLVVYARWIVKRNPQSL